MPARRVLYLHIGLQKTGTSYLQSIFWRNQELLADQGLDLVPGSKQGAFHLMLRVRKRYQPELDPPAVSQALERFTEALAHAPGDRALLSQESLAGCSSEQIRTLIEACRDREVHVVLTVRDLGRQLPSSWQQTLQSGASLEYGAYIERLRRLMEHDATDRRRLHLDPPLVLAHWAEHVPAERIHVVTVPPPGGSPTLLLERYCRVLGVDPTGLESEIASSNRGLGRVQSEVLRRVNAELAPDVKRRQVYGTVGKRYFAVQVLGAQDGPRIKVPEEFEAWCREVSDDHIVQLTAAGYRVEGHLDDLRSTSAAFATDELPPRNREVAASAISALVTMLTERGERRAEEVLPGAAPRGGAASPGPLRALAARVRRRVSQDPVRGKSH